MFSQCSTFLQIKSIVEKDQLITAMCKAKNLRSLRSLKLNLLVNSAYTQTVSKTMFCKANYHPKIDIREVIESIPFMPLTTMFKVWGKCCMWSVLSPPAICAQKTLCIAERATLCTPYTNQILFTFSCIFRHF